jgi:DegV family protein with EDD domain
MFARETLRAEYPDRRIEVVDTRRCTVLQGYTVYQACLLLESGAELDEIVGKLSAITEEHCVLISADSLEYLRKGGRLGKAGALAGSLLNIKPIIGFRDGELAPYSKVRGKKNAAAEIIKGINKYAGENKDDYVAISFTCDMPDECDYLACELENGGFSTVHKWGIGPVVGAHVGPTGFAAVVLKKYEGQIDF